MCIFFSSIYFASANLFCSWCHVHKSGYHSSLVHFIVFLTQFLNFSSFFGFPPGLALIAFFKSSIVSYVFGAKKSFLKSPEKDV